MHGSLCLFPQWIRHLRLMDSAAERILGAREDRCAMSIRKVDAGLLRRERGFYRQATLHIRGRDVRWVFSLGEELPFRMLAFERKSNDSILCSLNDSS